MQKTLTWILTMLAVALFGFIYFYERNVPGSAGRRAAPGLLPGISPGEVRAVEITLPGEGIIRAEQTDGVWFLTRPPYPAQQSAIETFVTNVIRLRQFDRIPQHEVVLQGQKAFGLEPPAALVLLETATNRVRLEVGGAAPLTNNIYVRLEPSTEVILTQADLLRSLPGTTNDWRSEQLLDLARMDFDRVEVRSGQRVLELAKNSTNRLWQLTRPIPARGDQAQIARLFERLESAQVGGFVADGEVELEPYGLQSPEVQLAFGRGAAQIFKVEFGGTVTNDEKMIYARLLGNTNIVTVGRELAEILKQPYKAFHDSRLVTVDPKAVDQIVVSSVEKFSILREEGGWVIGEKEKIPADSELVAEFLQTVLSMRILDIAKEVPTDADLEALGLHLPRISYAFFEKRKNAAGVLTNILFSEISFGTNLTDRIYARRSDENPVYITEVAPLTQLPHQAFRVKERRIWNLSTNDILRVTMIGPEGTNSARRSGIGWSADAVANAAMEEAVFRLSRLQVVRWMAKGEQVFNAAGITTESEVLEVEVRKPVGSETRRIRFGKPALRHNVYAVELLEGEEPLIFEFPGDIYHLLKLNLPASE